MKDNMNDILKIYKNNENNYSERKVNIFIQKLCKVYKNSHFYHFIFLLTYRNLHLKVFFQVHQL